MGFTQDAYIFGEGEGLVEICANLSRDIALETVTATFTAFSITAQIGENGDFMSQNGTLTFQSGMAERCIAVNITDDSILEANEVFGVNLSTNDLGTNSGQQSATVTITIIDDDGKFVTSVQLRLCSASYYIIIYLLLHVSLLEVNISLELAEYTVAEGEARQVCTSLSGQMERNVTITLFTMDDTAQGQYPRIQ